MMSEQSREVTYKCTFGASNNVRSPCTTLRSELCKHVNVLLMLDVAYTYGTGVTMDGCYVNLRTSDRRRKRDEASPSSVLSYYGLV